MDVLEKFLWDWKMFWNWDLWITAVSLLKLFPNLFPEIKKLNSNGFDFIAWIMRVWILGYMCAAVYIYVLYHEQAIFGYLIEQNHTVDNHQ